MMSPEEAIQKAKKIKEEFGSANKPQALIDLLLPVHQALFSQKTIHGGIMDALSGAMHQLKTPAGRAQIEQLYAEAYTAFSDNPYVIARYADYCLWRKGHKLESHKLLDSAIAKHGLIKDLVFTKRSCLQQEENYSAAIVLLEKFCETANTVDTNTLCQLAILYNKTGDFEKAVRTQQQVVKQTPSEKEKEILELYIVKLRSSGSSPRSNRTCNLSAQSTSEPIPMYNRLEARARALHAQKNDPEALAIYEYMFATYPRPELRTFLQAGELSYGMQGFKTAIKYYDFGLALYPDNPFLLNGKANCLFKLNRKREARILIEKAYALAPDNPKVASTYAKNLCLHGETEKTKQIIGPFVKIIRQNPESIHLAEKQIFIALDLALNPEEPKSDPALEKIFRNIRYVLRQARYIRSCNLQARISKSESPTEQLRLRKMLAANTVTEDPPPANEL